MTGPARMPHSPIVVLPEVIRAGAGSSVLVDVVVTHRGPTPAELTVTVLGLVPSWVPVPSRLGPVGPGESMRFTIMIEPEKGALGARYPFTVAVQATPPGGGVGLLGVAESVLVVDARERITLLVTPQMPAAVFSRRIRVQVSNPGGVDRELEFTARAAKGAAVSLGASRVFVPAGRTVTVPGRVRVGTPRLFGADNTHSFTIYARGLGAPELAEGTLRSKALIGGKVSTLLLLVTLVAVWVAAALVFIPKLSKQISSQQASDVGVSAALAPGASVSSGGPTGGGSGTGSGSGTGTGNGTGGTATGATGGPGAPSGSGSGSGAGSGSGSGSVGTGAGATGAGASGAGSTGAISAGAGTSTAGPAGTSSDGTSPASSSSSTSSPANAQTAGATGLSGVISGPAVDGFQVSLEPSSLVDAVDTGAAAAPGDVRTAQHLRDATQGAIGKIPESALSVAAAATPPPLVYTTGKNGGFDFHNVTSPGYYLLIASKSGYITQRFIIDSSQLQGATPLKIAMQAGDGIVSGTVIGPSGPVGAATVALTDGTVTLTTSTVSTGSGVGTWTVNGLSTPSTYLVTITAAGLGTESQLVTLSAGQQNGRADFTLKSGVAQINGTVTGRDALGRFGGLGGVTVTATGTSQGVTTTRTATTVTTGPVGHYVLPDLPVPGTYTVSVTSAGYAAQARAVDLGPGSSQATVDLSLTRSDGTVVGRVTGVDAAGHNLGGVVGAGLTLIGNATSFKTMTASSPAGSFQFTGVQPGVYVLTGALFGWRQASATVVVTASGTTTQNLVLTSAPQTELPTTSHIRGRAVDARTQGPLTCDQAAVPAPCVLTVTVPTSPTSTTLATNTAGPREDYTVPRIAADVPGLPAGLYNLTLSAPGYETAVTQVQVGEGQLVAAPQVALQPLARIDGTVTTKVGSTASASCVVAVPSTSPVPTACTVRGGTCTVSSAAARCVLTAADGSYLIKGLVHGGYTVVVLPTDPEYLPTTALSVQLGLAQDFRDDPVLDRLGRATVTVLAPNLTNLAVGPVAGAPVSLTGPTPRSATTGKGGSVLVTGLAPGPYRASSKGASGTDTVDVGTVGLNQSVVVTLVLTGPIGAAYGQMTVNVDGVPTPVPHVSVHVTGTVGFNGSAPVSGFADVVTDANGCYAVAPTATVFTAPSGPCTTPLTPAVLQTAAGAAAALVAYPITVQADANALVQSSVPIPLLVDSAGPPHRIPTVPLNAQTSDASKLAVAIEGDTVTEHLSTDVSLTVGKKPAGSGAVTVTTKSGSVGTALLDWQDASLTAPDQAVPGSYQIQATKLGYVTATFWVYCPLGAACLVVDDPATRNPAAATLTQFPSISGSVTLPSGAPAPSAITVTVASQPGLAGQLTVSADKTTGKITFSDASLAAAQDPAGPGGLAWPGTYVFTVSVPGYQDQPVTVSCGADYATPPAGSTVKGCSPFVATMRAIPTFAGTLQMNATDGSTQADALNVAAAAVTTGQSVNIAVDKTVGTLSWTDTNAPLAGRVMPGSYTLRFTGTNYVPVDVPVVVRVDPTSGDLHCYVAGVDKGAVCDLGTVTLQEYPAGGGTVSTADGAAVDWSKATVTIVSRPAGSGSLSLTLPQTTSTTAGFVWNDPTLPRTASATVGVTQPGSYVVSVALPGYQTARSDSIVCAAGSTCAPTLVLARNPVFSGTLTVVPATASPAGAVFNVNPLTADLPAVSLTLGTGTALVWQQTGSAPGLVTPGSYQVTVSAPGRDGSTVQFDCAVGSTTCTLPTLTLTSASDLSLVFVSSSSAAVPVNGVQVTLSGTSISSSTVTAPATSNTVQYGSLSPTPTYSIDVHAPGFRTTLGLSASSTAVTCVNDGSATTGLRVLAGGTTTCTIRIAPLATLTGSVQGVSGPTTSAVAYATIGVQQIVADPGDGTKAPTPTLKGGALQYVSPTFTTQGLSDATFSITGTVADQGLLPGLWQVDVSANGYTAVTGRIWIHDDLSITTVSGAALTMAGSALQVQLQVNRVALQAHLQLNGTDRLVPVSVRLYGYNGYSTTCVIAIGGTDPHAAADYTCGTGSSAAGVSVTVTDAATGAGYLTFSNLLPGQYTIGVTSSSQTYREVTATVQVVAGIDPQQVPLSLDERFSAQSFSVSMPGGISGTTTLSLRQVNDITKVASDANGKPLTVDASGAGQPGVSGVVDGTVTFVAVPDGQYWLVLEHAGYRSAVSPAPLVFDSTATPVTTPIALTSRAQRPATVTVTSLAKPLATDGSLVNLAGAALELDPPSPALVYPGLDPDVALTNLPVTNIDGKYGVSVTALGSTPPGTSWTAKLTGQANAPFPVTLSPASVTVSAPGLQENPVAPATATVTLPESLVTVTVTWAADSCLSGAPPAGTTMSVQLAKTGVTDPATLTASVVTQPDGSGTATAYAYLPAGSYTVTPQPTGTGWTAPTSGNTFTVNTVTAAGTHQEPAAVALVASKVPVPVTMTIDGAPAGAAYQVKAGGDTEPFAAGAATLCVAPSKTLAIDPSPVDTTDHRLLLATRTVDTATAGTVAFVGVTLDPTASDAVTGRPVDTADRNITFSATVGSATWSTKAVIKGGTTSIAASESPIVDSGVKIAVTAAPADADDVFDSASTPVTPTAAGTAVAITLKYTAVTILVSVVRGGSALSGAAVTLNPASGTAEQDTDAKGKTAFVDVAPGTYKVTAVTPASITPAVTKSANTPALVAGQVYTVSPAIDLSASGP